MNRLVLVAFLLGTLLGWEASDRSREVRGRGGPVALEALGTPGPRCSYDTLVTLPGGDTPGDTLLVPCVLRRYK